jgi:diguanylate cyclase (GGDEF)-like protein/PAS domain S-box-containing protein
VSEETASERLLVLAEAGREIARAPDAAAIARAVIETVGKLLPSDAAGVLTRTEDGDHLELLAFSGEYEGVAPGQRLPVADDGPAARTLRRGKSSREDGPPSRLVAVLSDGDASLGVLEAQASSPGAFSQDEETLLASLGRLAGLALHDRRHRSALEEERRRLSAILDCSADAIVTTDKGGRVTFFSPGATELFGYSVDSVLGRNVSEFYLEGEVEARRVQRHLEEESRVRNLEVWFRTAADDRVPASLSASILRDEAGQVLGTLGVLKDITVEKRLERKLSYTIEMLQEANENLGRLAMTDSLSGLKNQRFFHRKLEEELLRTARTARPVSLLMVDIDKFKRFNDDHGHQVGDRVIQEVGATILESIRKIDHGCRYGGEEFTIVLPETSTAQALVVANRLRESFAERPAWAELGLAPPTLSIGLAQDTSKDTDSVDTDGLIRAADDAMYRVKREGGDGIETD